MPDNYFLRRVYLDVIGRIPTYEEALKFYQSKDKDKRSKLISELLNSDGYVNNQFNFWAEILRYKPRIQNISLIPYGRWITQSIQENKPYDVFVREMLKASGKFIDNPAIGYYLRDSNDRLSNVSNTSQAFLGIQIDCARCHDHALDKWMQFEYYEFAAMSAELDIKNKNYNKIRNEINNSLSKTKKTNLRNIADKIIYYNSYSVDDNSKRVQKLPGDYKYDDAKPNQVVSAKPLFGNLSEESEKTLREKYADWLTSRDNPMFTKMAVNRLWKQLMGYAIVEPVDNFTESTKINNPELMNYLEKLFKDLNYDVKAFQEVLLNTRVYQSFSSGEDISEDNYYTQVYPLKKIKAEQLWDSFLTLYFDDVDKRNYLLTDEEDRNILKTDNLDADSVIELAQKIYDSRKDNPNKDLSKTKMMRSSAMHDVDSEHFLKKFGFGDNDVISDGTNDSSVIQVLSLLNGQFTNELLDKKNSVLYRNLKDAKTSSEKINIIFLSILSRYPTLPEKTILSSEMKDKNSENRIVWALLNSNEFLFIK